MHKIITTKASDSKTPAVTAVIIIQKMGTYSLKMAQLPSHMHGV
jgi:hypothetical protein